MLPRIHPSITQLELPLSDDVGVIGITSLTVHFWVHISKTPTRPGL